MDDVEEEVMQVAEDEVDAEEVDAEDDIDDFDDASDAEEADHNNANNADDDADDVEPIVDTDIVVNAEVENVAEENEAAIIISSDMSDETP